MQRYFAILTFLILLVSCKNNQITSRFIFNEGSIFSTWYHISYESPNGADLSTDIDAELKRMDYIFSTYKKESTLSKVNQNLDAVLEDHFVTVFDKSMEVSKLSDGAFDVTVAPLVNIWGFGFTKKEIVNQKMIDSIQSFVGYQKVKIENGEVLKNDPRLMLDFSAISKGYAVDAIGNLLRDKGCKSYMVEIGGEVVAHGVNKEGKLWRIGINEPNDNEPAAPAALQAIVSLKNKAVATSGNYRNFYIENGKKFAHTINPHTGYPVDHSLLSATVIANDCMTADAFATAFMVLGVDGAQKLAAKLNDVDVYLIYSDKNQQNQVFMTKGFEKYLLQ